MSRRLTLLFLVFGLLLSFPGVVFAGANNNACDQPGEAPDIIVGSIYGSIRHGKVGDITAYSFGTESCNIGTCEGLWNSGSPGTIRSSRRTCSG